MIRLSPGSRFGRLVVIRMAPDRTVGGEVQWLCECDCGDTLIVRGHQIRSERTRSCGCLAREAAATNCRNRARHGEGSNGKETPEYRCWANMLSRCNNTNHRLFKNYGARGIKVCKRWHTYENFLEDMGRRPSSKHSIDRERVNGDYKKSNCRWSISTEQNRNKRNTRMITHDGRTEALAYWIEHTGIAHVTFYRRVAKGMSASEALGYQKFSRK